jgi:flagellar FliL protein
MAAEVEKKEETTAPAKKGKGLLIAIIAVAVIGAAVGAYFIFGGKKSAPAEGHGAEAEASSHEAAAGAHGEPAVKDTLFNLEPFIVNLQDNSGTRYLKLTINLELSEGASAADLTAQSTQIRDSLIILLSSKSYTDIGTVEGKYLMRDEIVARVNQFLKKGKVKTAYFTEFVIQ